jgi:hypothetical protein
MTNEKVEVKTHPSGKPEDKFTNSKASLVKEPADDEDIDEFIKKHLDEDKEKEKTS